MKHCDVIGLALNFRAISFFSCEESVLAESVATIEPFSAQPLHHCRQVELAQLAVLVEVCKQHTWHRRNARARKREIPEKTRRPAASSGTIPTCGNPGVTQLGIEPGSHLWEASIPVVVGPRDRPREEECRNAICAGQSILTSRGRSRGIRGPVNQTIVGERRRVPAAVCTCVHNKLRDTKAKGGECRQPLTEDLEDPARLHYRRTVLGESREKVQYVLKGQVSVSVGREHVDQPIRVGAAVVQWSDYSPPTQANRIPFPAPSLQDFSHAGLVPDDAAAGLRGFLGDIPPPPPLHSGTAPYSPRVTHIGSQDLSTLRAAQVSSPPPLEHAASPAYLDLVELVHDLVSSDSKWNSRLFRELQLHRLATKMATTSPLHIISPFAHQLVVTCPPASKSANREPFARRSSQLDTIPVP
ncbi:hypothetical protein PR048_029569 [Dryococelus australis]|uniref:Uncharacterized protein n=1 Tax=Dryococelus australis TaxID=614101 RepID=A0ABQ9GDS9_9NEOP|nr:hypothetical protein PR048_029569 [Dryococelus australis]